MSVYPQAFIDYLVYFHTQRDFFECHEVLEEYWKEHPDDPLASAYVGLIQVAVSLYHQRRFNLPGAGKMLKSALNILNDADMMKLGIDAVRFRRELQTRLEQLSESDFQYEDMDIPLADPLLQDLCLKLSTVKKLTWQTPSNLTDHYLIHKHTLRDRSVVIAERERSRQMKQAAKRRKG
jgi:predicted metal-dependent hydrolase